MCYIKGGTLAGSSKQYLGCRDKSDPIDLRPIELEFELYFSGRSKTWGNGGVAFIRELENRERRSTLGRMYLIMDEQFNDVLMQENSRIPEGSRFVPTFEQLVSQRELFLSDNSWYGSLLNIGSQGGHPILTFTTGRTDLRSNPHTPSEQYVKMIVSGIKEIYPQMSNDDIVVYFLRADGIRGNVDLAKIQGWVAVA
jgi:hypothetical protein